MREAFHDKKTKYAVMAIMLLAVFGISGFYYQKSDGFAALEKESASISENSAVKNTGTDDKKRDNISALNAAAIDVISGDSGEKKIMKWVENIIGYKKTKARTLSVPDDYETIQSAINDANRGDVVKVVGGEYKENIIMKNGVSLEGTGADATIIDGNNFGNVVTFKNVRDSRTYLSGFTIKNAGKSLSGVSIENSSPWIHDNVITENEFGIYIKGESRPVIQKNVINNSSKGIQAYNFVEEKANESMMVAKADNVASKSNAILNLAQGEKEITDEDGSKTNPIIIDNLITDNKIGIDLHNSHASIEHNNISYNNHYKTYLGATYGINISSSSSNISSNIITDNGICELCAGINADESSKNILINYNDIWNNKNDFLCFGECVLEDNNISEDPLYVDTMTGEYKLQAESTLIGKAKDGLDVGIRW